MVLKRVGGKSKLAKWIRGHMPHHRIFVDVFGGSGAVTDVMNPVSDVRYVFNDLDSKIYTFFKILQGRSLELSDLVSLTPYSRKIFDESYDVLLDDISFGELDMLDQALIFLIVNRQSFGAKMALPWSITRDGEINYQTWGKMPSLILEVAQRWKKVFLENLDYRELLNKWDDEKAVFYLDPPYEGVESDYYEVNKSTGFDHDEMFDRLQEVEGSYVVSYYDQDIVKKYESAGCQVFTQDVKMHLSSGDQKTTKTEVLIVNKNNWSSMNHKGRQGKKIDFS